MTHLINHMQSTIKREVTKIYKESFGKGPDNTEVAVCQNFIFIKIQGAFSQIEESLMNSTIGMELVERIRDELILSSTAAYIPAVEKIVNEKVIKINYILEEKKNNLYIFLMFENDIGTRRNGEWGAKTTKLKEQKELAIKRELARLYKQNFGKGPDTTEVKIYENFVLLKFGGAFSQIEGNLLKLDGGVTLVEKIRDEMILKQTDAYVPTLEKIVEAKVSKVNYMIQEHRETMYMCVLFEDEIRV